jgi:putative transcriptional regulator
MKINLDAVLKSKNKTRYWLAKETGITYQNIDNLAKNKTTGVKFNILEKICIALDCTPNDIFDVENK